MDENQSDQMMRLLAEVNSESDRAAAILAAAAIDQRLTRLLVNLFGAETSQSTSLFRPDDPLGSLSAKIEILFRIGIIGTDLHRELHLLRKLRNKFAHSEELISFEKSPIRDFAAELNILDKIRDNPELNLPKENYSARERFIFSVIKILIYLEFLIETRKPFTHRGDEMIRDIVELIKADKSEQHA
ncbi:MAG: MltR family transcriptional regulator [Desulfobacteraceae bacterium]|jgi:DNA-binding MltR family transcriptional regulator